MKDQDFSSFLCDIIFKKRWEEIKENWLGYIKEINPPGSPQTEGIEDFLTLTPICDKLFNSADNFIIEDADYIRNTVFRDAVFSLHKASNIISNAQNDIVAGYKTWSVVNAYHGSYLAARSILGFLGFAAPVLSTSSSQPILTLVDCWPSLTQPPTKRKDLKLGGNKSVLFAQARVTKLDQRHTWMILQRYIAVLTIEETVWPKNFIKIVNGIEPKDFGRQRNYLFYQNDSWLFDDLHEYLSSDHFGIVDELFIAQFREKGRSLYSDFSIGISIIIFKMAFSLFQQVCSLSKQLQSEYLLLNKYITSEDKHPLLAKSLAL